MSNILWLIDDDIHTQQWNSSIYIPVLSSYGVNISVAHYALDAIEAAHRSPFTVIFSDAFAFSGCEDVVRKRDPLAPLFQYNPGEDPKFNAVIATIREIRRIPMQRKTPILVGGLIDPIHDRRFPNARRMYRAAGATLYFEHTKTNIFKLEDKLAWYIPELVSPTTPDAVKKRWSR